MAHFWKLEGRQKMNHLMPSRRSGWVTSVDIITKTAMFRKHGHVGGGDPARLTYHMQGTVPRYTT